MTSKLHRNYVTVLLPTRADQEFDEPAYRAYLKSFLDNKRFASNGGLIINLRNILDALDDDAVMT